MSDPAAQAVLSNILGGAQPQQAQTTPQGRDKAAEAVLADVFGSAELATHAMTGNVSRQPNEFNPDRDAFLNPNTGQMTTRELLKGQAKQDMTRANSLPMMSAHGASLGTSDEAAYLAGRIDSPEMARFQQEKQRGFIEAAREENPWSSFVAELLGGLAIPGSILKEGVKAKGAGQAIKQGAKAGAVTGGLYAAGEGEGVAGRFRDIPGGAAGGALGGALAVPVGKAVIWAGKKLGKGAGRIFADRRYYNEASGVTPAGREALQAIGIDPDTVSREFAREFSKNIDEGVDPLTAEAAAQMGEFGIPAYNHNVTGNPVDFADFERARRGGAGGPAATRVARAASNQEAAANRAIDSTARQMADGVPGDQLDAATAVTGRLDEIRAQEKAASQAAYRAADRAGVSVNPEVARGITQRIQTRLANEEIDTTSDLFVKTRSYMSRLQKRGAGEDGVSLKLIDTFRKDLNKTLSKTVDPDDKRALTIIKDEYDKWVDDVVSAKLFEGDEAGFEKLKEARELWAAYAKKFRGKDATSKFLQDVIDADASPEQVTKWLFGTGKLGGGRMNSKLAKGLKGTLGKTSDEWNLVRQAAFRQLTQKPGTEDITAQGLIRWGPQKVSENINTFLNSPATRSLAAELFTPKERAQMRRLAGALKRMVPPPGSVNYSGTAYEGSRMAQKSWEAIVGLIGFKTGGPAGGIAAREGAKAASGVKSAIDGKRLTRPFITPKHIGSPSTGAIGGAQAGVGATNLLFPAQQEQDQPK